MNLNSLFDSRVDVVFTWVFTEHEIDRESSTGDDEDGHIAEKISKLARIHRGGSDDKFQILSTTHNLNRHSL